MHLFMNVCVYVYIACTLLHHIIMHVSVYACAYACVFECTLHAYFIHHVMYVFVYICVFMCISHAQFSGIHACMYVCVCVHIYVCVYIYIYTLPATLCLDQREMSRQHCLVFCKPLDSELQKLQYKLHLTMRWFMEQPTVSQAVRIWANILLKYFYYKYTWIITEL